MGFFAARGFAPATASFLWKWRMAGHPLKRVWGARLEQRK